ncbi:hypothetical protein ACJRO7_019839 [Eucalyptus globulus]|uniref:Disease resistance protein n=1 Tax=Eucalyptus globulus TaxID=34317 RepID=A0ABD3KMR0_EUCGL
MAEFVVSYAVQTIGKLLVNKADFLWGVETQVEDLLKELKLIRCFLRDADARREYDEAVGEWVMQIQDMAYDAEDAIEGYILRDPPKKGENIIKAYACFVAKCTCLQVHVVRIEIEGLKSKISDLGRNMQEYGIQSMKKGEYGHAGASTEEDFVGREDSIKELVKELLNDGKQHRVIFILGMGGLGKTALAKKVVAHDKVKNNFDGFTWACVSQEDNEKDILVEILVKLIPDQRERIMKMMDYELSKTLYEIQQQKRCIVVLDDIWTKEAWDSLRAAFPIEDTRSKLLITTRNRKVAEYIDPHGLFHEPRRLSDGESWNLLKKRALLQTKGISIPKASRYTIRGIPINRAFRLLRYPKTLLEASQSHSEASQPNSNTYQLMARDQNIEMYPLGDELLKKCEGLPSAIIAIGKSIAVNGWEKVYKNINLHFTNESDVKKVSASSYESLPWHLKPCFLYLGSFSKDVEIPATKVLHMWIAEGFVSPSAYNNEESEITMEDAAEQYLKELVKKGMVQVLLTSSGKIKTCRLPDRMRDLCISKAREERFLSILKAWQVDELTTRRLSVTVEEKTFWRVEKRGKTMFHLRTLMFFYYGRFVEKMWDKFQPIFLSCKFLRVLKLEGIHSRTGSLPKLVGNLVHLRFLSLAGCVLKGLPKSMGNLVHLEFLDLQVKDLVEVIMPNVLWKMRSLRHLHLPIHFAVNDLKKLRLDSLKHLQTLRNFYPKNCNVIDVGKLTNLRKLIVSNQYGGDEFKIIPQLAKFTLKHLQSSSFRFISHGSFCEGELSKMSSYPYSCKLFMKGKIEKLPEDLPPQLRKLILIKSQLEEDPMPILEKLHHLVVLILLEDAFVGKEIVCSARGFPQLKHLALDNLQNLEEWRVAEGAMPHLSQLRISRCFKLKTRPEVVYKFDGSVDNGDEQEDMRPFLSEVSFAALLIRRINMTDLVY